MKRSPVFISIGFALLAAFLYGFSIPFSKVLLNDIPPYFMASLLYLGAGFGMFLISMMKKKNEKTASLKFIKTDRPYIFLMILLDILAPILLLVGLTLTTAANASLLNNLEIVATAIIALFFFKEVIRKHMWIAILFIVFSGVLLSFEDISEFRLNIGTLFIIGAAFSWGLENNCTRKLSIRDPINVVVIKGIFSGLGSLIIAIFLSQLSSNFLLIFLTLVLGFFSYGLSLFFYISAQRHLGAAKTSAFYAIAPFVGVFISIVFLNEPISIIFIIALLLMIVGAFLASIPHKADNKI